MKVYHATNHKITKLDYKELLRNISNNMNGALGLWCCYETTDWMRGFGSFMYEISLENKVFQDLPIDDLVSWNNQAKDHDFYSKKREEFLAKNIDYLKLIEMDGTSHMLIILNFKNLKIKLI